MKESKMDLIKYQLQAHSFADYTQPIILDDERKREIIKELGDCLWFVSEIATLLNVSFEEVMQKNIDKLTSRRERGVIYGSGDNR